jgi:hypothetical protein
MSARPFLVTCVLVSSPLSGQGTITLPAQDRTLAASTQHLFSIGRLEGRPWEVFGSVVELEFGPDGSLYVLDRDNAAVHSFDTQGRHRWSAGRSGGGPGEFSALTTMAVLSGGDVVVADQLQSRLEHFSGSGRHMGTISLPTGVRPRRIHSAGARSVWLIPSSAARRGDSLPIMQVTLDSRATVVAHVPVQTPSVQRDGNTLRRVLPPTFGPVLRTTSAGARLVVLEGTEYRLALHGGDRAALSRALAPRPVSSADREAARERIRRNAASAQERVVDGFRVLPMDAAAVEERTRQMTFAATVPVIQELRGGPDGTLWVARAGRVAFGAGPVDVIDQDLRYLGTLAAQPIPDAIGPGGLMAVVDTGELGVPVIRVSRVTFRP